MHKPPKKTKKPDTLINVLKTLIRKRRITQQAKKIKRKAARKDQLMKLRGHLGNFMEAAFEPKPLRIARKKKKKEERHKAL